MFGIRFRKTKKKDEEKNLGLTYGEYKARIAQHRKDGQIRAVFTTWREDLISKMIKGCNLYFTKGDRFYIEIIPGEEDFQHISDEI